MRNCPVCRASDSSSVTATSPKVCQPCSSRYSLIMDGQRRRDPLFVLADAAGVGRPESDGVPVGRDGAAALVLQVAGRLALQRIGHLRRMHRAAEQPREGAGDRALQLAFETLESTPIATPLVAAAVGARRRAIARARPLGLTSPVERRQLGMVSVRRHRRPLALRRFHRTRRPVRRTTSVQQRRNALISGRMMLRVNLYRLLGRVAKWQTRTVQVRVLETGWGFNSPLAHSG